MDFSSTSTSTSSQMTPYAAVLREAFPTTLAATPFTTQQTPIGEPAAPMMTPVKTKRRMVTEELCENRCVTCKINLGQNNPKQVCGKTHCDINTYNISDDDDYDERQPALKTFLTQNKLINIWRSNPYQRWNTLPCNEVFYVDSIDYKEMKLLDKYNNEFIILIESIPFPTFRDILNKSEEDWINNIFSAKLMETFIKLFVHSFFKKLKDDLNVFF